MDRPVLQGAGKGGVIEFGEFVKRSSRIRQILNVFRICQPPVPRDGHQLIGGVPAKGKLLLPL